MTKIDIAIKLANCLSCNPSIKTEIDRHKDGKVLVSIVVDSPNCLKPHLYSFTYYTVEEFIEKTIEGLNYLKELLKEEKNEDK